MNAIRSIRKLLELSQADLGGALGVTQGNVSFYEKGQTVPPDVARRLIEFAKTKGHVLTFDHVYGATPIPGVDAADEAEKVSP